MWLQKTLAWEDAMACFTASLSSVLHRRKTKDQNRNLHRMVSVALYTSKPYLAHNRSKSEGCRGIDSAICMTKFINVVADCDKTPEQTRNCQSCNRARLTKRFRRHSSTCATHGLIHKFVNCKYAAGGWKHHPESSSVTASSAVAAGREDPQLTQLTQLTLRPPNHLQPHHQIFYSVPKCTISK